MLPLSRLGRRDSAGMIGGITGNKALPNAVVEQIVSRADGVPLFIEELTSSLLESGVLRETADGYELDRLLPALAVPATLQASLVARLDRLVTVKDLAQIGAAIGREFSHELIAAVATLAPNDLDAALERLISSGLISRRGIPPVATYAFKHALVQDAAYETQLKNRRQAVHRSIAEVLRERFAEVAVSTPEVVAHHYTQAGLAPDAVVWWRKAGEQALRRAAHVEALRHLDRGRALIPACPDTPERSREELNLEVCRGAVLLMLRGQGAPEVREAYDRAALISRGMPESEEVFLVLFGLWRTQIGYNEMEGARETGVRLLDMAERLGDRALLLGARMALGMALYHLADLEGAWRHVESGVVLQGELGEADRESPVFVIGQLFHSAAAGRSRWGVRAPAPGDRCRGGDRQAVPDRHRDGLERDPASHERRARDRAALRGEEREAARRATLSAVAAQRRPHAWRGAGQDRPRRGRLRLAPQWNGHE
jgi:predicted ATPase